MPRGNYDIQGGMDVEASKQSGRDSSYRACVHAMLIFLLVCIILLLAAWPWKGTSTDNKAASNSSSSVASANKGDMINSSSTTTRRPEKTTRRPEKTTRVAQTPTTTQEPQFDRKPLTTVIPDEFEETTTQKSTEAPPPPPVVFVTEATYTDPPDDAGDNTTHEAHDEDGRELPNENSIEQTTDLAALTTTEGTDFGKDQEGDKDHTVESSTTKDNAQGTTEVSDAVTLQTDDTTVLTVTTEEVTVTPTEPAVTSTVPLSSRASMMERLVDDPERTTVTSSLDPALECGTSQCKVQASRMLRLMNHAVDPCDDFYEFSCGGLRSSPDLVGDNPQQYAFDRINGKLQTVTDSSNEAHRKFQRYYKSCVNYDKEVSVDQRKVIARRVLDTIGVFNEFGVQNPQLEDFTTLLGNMILLHSTPILDITLDVDTRNVSRFALKLTPSSFKNPFGASTRFDQCTPNPSKVTDLNVSYRKYSECREAAISSYVQELEIAMRSLGITNSSETIHDVRADAELEFFAGWMESFPKPDSMKKALIGKNFVEMTIKQLNQQYDLVDWKALSVRLLNREVSETTKVQVYFKSYFDGLFTELEVTKPRNRQNMLLAWLIHDLYEDFVLTRSPCTRESYCLHVASELMEDVSSSLYLSSFPPAELQAMSTEVEQVFSELRTAMEPQLRDATWLNEQSRSAAVSKLNSLTLAVDGGQSVFLDEALLNRRMEDMNINEDNYFTMSMVLLKRYRRQMYSLYDVNPSSVQAIWTQFSLPYYSSGTAVYALKKIVIPYGLMTWPLYEPTLPRYLLMARLGFVIAHEMAHHFDKNGIKYGEVLSDNSETSFVEMTLCHKDVVSFDAERRADDGRLVKFKVSEQLTLNERLADRTAAALSLEAYSEWAHNNYKPQRLPYLDMSNEKVYFIAIAQMFCSKTTILDYGVSLFEDEHPPPFLRVNTVFDNSPEFASEFECAAGVLMNPNPSNNCDVFPKLTAVTATQSTIFS